MVCSSAVGSDIELAKRSTLEAILKKSELWVGFDSGYMPFEMTDQKGRYVGFDIDIAKEMSKAMGVKFVPVNTACDDIIPSLTASPCPSAIGFASGDCRAGLAGGRACMAGGLAEWLRHFNGLAAGKTAVPHVFCGKTRWEQECHRC